MKKEQENNAPTSLDLAIICAQVAHEKKADDIVLMDLRELTVVTDFFIVCTASSRPQVKALLNEMISTLRKNGRRKLGFEGDEGSTWMLCDFGDLIVHVFSPDARKYYDLEMLWGDAPKINWQSAAIKEQKGGNM